jgi:sortase B
MKKRNLILNLLLLICIIIAAYAGYQIYLEYTDYHAGTVEYDKLQEIAKENGLGNSDDDSSDDSSLPFKDEEDATKRLENIYASMKSQNSDYMGWLYVNDTISYPVVQRDNDYYLRRTFSGNYNRAGTLFIEETVENGWDSPNVLVYGHNLMNDKMFGTLDDYESKQYCEKHPVFYVFLENEYRIYKVFSAYQTKPNTNTYQVSFEDDLDYQTYIQAMLDKSYYQVENEALDTKNIVTLSTCTNKDDGRFVIHGYLEKIVKKS